MWNPGVNERRLLFLYESFFIFKQHLGSKILLNIIIVNNNFIFIFKSFENSTVFRSFFEFANPRLAIAKIFFQDGRLSIGDFIIAARLRILHYKREKYKKETEYQLKFLLNSILILIKNKKYIKQEIKIWVFYSAATI